MTHWSTKYIGIPHADQGRSMQGFDCWGLVQQAYETELSIKLPSYVEDYVSCAEHEQIDALISDAALKGPWCPVIIDYKPLDVITFQRGHYITHVGLFVAEAMMLHVGRNSTVRIEPFERGLWAQRRPTVYRYTGAK